MTILATLNAKRNLIIFKHDIWNYLSDDIVKSPSISVFKKRLSGVKFDRFLTVTD